MKDRTLDVLIRNYLAEPDPLRWLAAADRLEELGDPARAGRWRRRGNHFAPLYAAALALALAPEEYPRRERLLRLGRHEVSLWRAGGASRESPSWPGWMRVNVWQRPGGGVLESQRVWALDGDGPRRARRLARGVVRLIDDFATDD